jgi:ATP-binding cassette, subfamily C, bacterial
VTTRRRAKTPTVLQMEAVECGAASLGMILGYYGRWIPLSELRVLTGVSRDGSNARNMLTVARSFGLEAHGFRRSADEVLEGRFPVIVFWGFEHFLVVEGCRRDTVFLNDPASGPIRISRQEFAETYSGVTLEFEPTASFKRGGHRQATWPLIAERLRGAGLPIAIVFLCALPLGILSILIPAFTRIFIDDVLIRELEDWLRPLLAAFLFALVVQATLTAIQQRMLAKLQNWLSITQSSRFVWHLMTLPLSFFSQRRTGDFAQRLQANDRIAELIGGELGSAALQVVVASATASAMLLYQPLLALVAIAAGLISALGLAYVSRLRANAVERMRAYQALLYAQTITTIQNIEHVKSIGAENESFMKWAGQQASLVNVEQRLSIINAATAVVPQFLFGLANAAVFGFGGLLVMRGELSSAPSRPFRC